MLKIDIEQFPEKEHQILSEMVEISKEVIPCWVHRLLLTNRPGHYEAGALASIDVMEDYRFATIYFYQAFFDQSHSEMLYAFLHEIAHIITGRAETVAEDIVKSVYPDENGPARTFMLGQLAKAREATTQDLALAFLRILDKEHGTLVDWLLSK